ncbi:MAG TPA: GNAT family N-acetyltransferase [Ilumatobacteraceae bacterium]
MKLAWFVPSNEVAVIDTWDALRDLATASNKSGVTWWIADRHEPTVTEGCDRLEFLHQHGVSPHAFTPLERQPRLSIERVWLDNVDVELLISQLNSDLYSRYPEPGALVFSLETADIVDGVGALLMADLDGEPVGCGAFRMIDDLPGSAEIKRLYVTLAGRGKKIGSALLAELERIGAALGVRRFALETGPRQPEAMRIFEAAGYVVCTPWGPFIGKEFSICMEKLQPPC